MQLNSYAVRPFECLQPPPEIVDADEVGEVVSELIVVVVMETHDEGGLDYPVHPFDLAIRRRI